MGMTASSVQGMTVAFPPNLQQEVRAQPRKLPAPFSSSWLNLTVAGSCQLLTTTLFDQDQLSGKGHLPFLQLPPAPKGIAAVKTGPSRFLPQPEGGSRPGAAPRAASDPRSPFPLPDLGR